MNAHPALHAGGSWHQLASGRAFALEGRATPLGIEDVAASLSKICRFAGACTRFYSVAQHSVLVSRLAARRGAGPTLQMHALLHDATEIVLGDIPRPVKRRVPALKHVEREIWIRIAVGLGIYDLIGEMNDDDETLLKWCDATALSTERDLYMASAVVEWGELPPPVEPWALGLTREASAPWLAEKLFLDEWNNVHKELVAERALRGWTG